MPVHPADHLDLPQQYRLPDLSTIRTFAEQDRARWADQAIAAATWGPDQRNGHQRITPARGVIRWIDTNGDLSGPGEWTPYEVNPLRAEWARDDGPHQRRTQPSVISLTALTWHHERGRHRVDGPAHLTVNGVPTWYWLNQQPGLPVHILLTDTWTDTALPDATARHLLDRAGTYSEPGSQTPVPAPVWLAHVLLAHPSPHLSADLLTWCRLLAG